MKTTAAARTQTQSKSESREQKMNTVMTKMIVVAAIVGASMSGTESQGAIITSGNFSLGYGYNKLAEAGTVVSWNGLENTDPRFINVNTLGDFSLVPTLTGITYTAGGTAFTDRELVNGGSEAQSAYITTMSLAGTWAGTKPADAAADPNYRITINITGIKIWAYGYEAPQPRTLVLRETTPGYTQDYATFTPPFVNTSMYNPGPWTQNTWDTLSNNYTTSGTSSTRSLWLGPNDLVHADLDAPMDGLEIYGNVVLTYDVIPEPTGLLLLGTGTLLVLARRRQRAT